MAEPVLKRINDPAVKDPQDALKTLGYYLDPLTVSSTDTERGQEISAGAKSRLMAWLAA